MSVGPSILLAPRARPPRAAAPRAPVLAPDLGPADALDEVAAFGVGGIFENKGVFRVDDIEDHRNAAAIERAMTEPLATPPGARPFGKVVVFRPALANTPPSPAYLFRLARYTDKVLVAYSYAKPGEDVAPRPVDEIYGVKVPPELRGKIWVSGDPANVMVPWSDLATVFERQLDALDGSPFLDGGAIDDAGLTIVAASAGGVDAAETRRRLEAGGRAGVIGKLVNVSTPMGGAPIADDAFFGLALRALEPTRRHVPVAARALAPDSMRRAFTKADERLVDLAVTNSLEGDTSNARPIMKALSKVIRWNPLSKERAGENDGWVRRESMEFGRERLHLDRAYDHPGMLEDPRIVDDIARHLAGRR